MGAGTGGGQGKKKEGKIGHDSFDFLWDFSMCLQITLELPWSLIILQTFEPQKKTWVCQAWRLSSSSDEAQQS